MNLKELDEALSKFGIKTYVKEANDGFGNCLRLKDYILGLKDVENDSTFAEIRCFKNRNLPTVWSLYDDKNLNAEVLDACFAYVKEHDSFKDTTEYTLKEPQYLVYVPASNNKFVYHKKIGTDEVVVSHANSYQNTSNKDIYHFTQDEINTFDLQEMDKREIDD